MIKLIAELGINHNGDLNIAKRMIDYAHMAGFNMIKLQKRNPEVCVPEDQKSKIKETPWGNMTYIEYKHKIEFDFNQYAELQKYSGKRNMELFASVWDIDSANFMRDFTCVAKIPSALITDLELLKYCRNNYYTLMISTGMSTEEEIENAVNVGRPDIIFHSIASYPTKDAEAKLQYITWLSNKYKVAIGYSGHDDSNLISFAACALGAKYIERHITLDRTMWGSDQSFSLDPDLMNEFVYGVRSVERSLTGYEERELLESEKSKKISLRK